MRVTIRTCAAYVIGFSIGLAALFGRSVAANGAEDASPSAFVVLAGPGELLSDAQYLLSLTDKTEQKQWPVLKSYLEVFLIGVDMKLPTRIDVIFDQKADRYVWSVPVDNFKKFRKDNIESILTPRIREINPGLYKLGSGKKEDFNGFLLFAAPYAHLGEKQQDVTQVPQDPRPGLQALLNRHFAVAFEMHNQKTDAASQTKRREIFQTTRKQTLGELKKEKGETAADFELRKKAAEIQLDETEWYFSESEHVLGGLTLDTTKGLGRFEIDLTPIADSALAKSVAQLQTKPSHFANVEKRADPILSARLNHPLGDARKKTATALAALIRDRLKARVDADDTLKSDEKESSHQLIDKTSSLIDAGIKEGLADGFVDVHKATSGKNVLLAGIRTVDGTKVDEILNLMPKARAGADVKLNVAEESGVKIHSVEMPKDRHPHWNNFIGADTLYVGSSKDAVWCAAGDGALDALKGAIKKAAQPAPAGAEKTPWAELIVRLKPWVQEAATEPPKKKGDDRYRKLAVSALEAGDDQLSVRMTRQENKVMGQIEVQTGLLRFAGKVAADFSKENLDEDAQKGAKDVKKATKK